MIQRECARADRSGIGFSLVAFTLRDNSTRKGGFLSLERILTERVRATDQVGWFGPRLLAVLLPDTPSVRARHFASDVKARIPAGDVSEVRIYGYPSEWLADSSNDSRSSGSEAETGEPNPSDSTATPPLRNEIAEDGLECLLDSGIPFWKRVIDIVGGSILLLLLIPVFLFVGVLVKVVSTGPVFYRQERIGRLGQRFTLWKFRTMIASADTKPHEQHLRNLIHSDAAMEKLDDADDRVIPFGRFLRKLGLDELPQLINVLRGEMSLIGPRPCIPYEAREYAIWHRKRFNTLPGLTGLWQVSGKNKTTHTQMMRLDISYVQKRSLWLDLKIALRTWPAVIHQAIETPYPKRGGKDGNDT